MRCDLCKSQAVFHITVARQRLCAEEKHLCEKHGQDVAETVPPEPLPTNGAARAANGMARFDIDMLVISEISDIQIIFLREEGGSRRFHLVCGIFEATSLDRTLKHVAATRPLTHDAWAGTIRALGGTLEDVLVSDLSNHTYYAKLRIRQTDGRSAEVDVRPSDALNLAVLCGVPILIAEQVLAAVGARGF
jgi:bifunctional DNase/RNase